MNFGRKYARVAYQKMRWALLQSNSRRGWVLVEALIGMTILVVGLLAILASYTQTTKTSTFSDNTTQATYIAQQELEKLKRDFDATTTTPDVAKCSTKNGIFTIKCTLATGTAPFSDLNIIPVSAKVSWNNPNEGSITVTTYYFYRNLIED